MKSGIYLIVNIIDAKFYVGSAFDFSRRFARHKRLLNSNGHPNAHLQNAWNKYGENCFVFKILELHSKEGLIEREQFWLDAGKSYEREIGYNICKVADNRTGILHSEDTKKKMSISGKGRIVSQETRDKLSRAHKGKIVSEESKKRMSEAQRNKNYVVSDETKANMAKGQTGRKHSEESKRKRSEKLKGRKVGGYKMGEFKHSEETKRKISESRLRLLHGK